MKMIKQALRRSAAAMSRGEPAKDAPLRVIIFIGHHKVGSTSLQDYLSRNAAALSRAGILYPYVDFEGMAHLAATANGQLQHDGALPLNVREPHNALAYRMLAVQKGWPVSKYHKLLPALPQMTHAIRQQIRFCDPHTVILASEVMGHFDLDMIKQLAGYFPAADFTVIATLRRVDSYLASWHGQRLKFGHKVAALREDGVEAYVKGFHFNYRKMVESWLKALPRANVILRDYSDVNRNGGSVADFIAQTGLKLPAGLRPERRENASIHRSIYEILRQANLTLPRPKAALLRNDLREMTPNLPLPPSHRVELFGAENRAKMLDRFRPIDAWLGDVMGTTGFFADLEAILEPEALPELEAARDALDLIRARDGWCGDAVVMDFISSLTEDLQPGRQTVI